MQGIHYERVLSTLHAWDADDPCTIYDLLLESDMLCCMLFDDDVTIVVDDD